MYIPSTFFSTQGSCITATTTSITGSGAITSGTFVSASVLYQYYQFEMTNSDTAGLTPFTASLNVLSGSTGQAKVLIVGGGGSSGRRQVVFTPDGSGFSYQNDYPGGGGAGGVVYYDNFPLSSGSYEIGVASATTGTTGASGSKGGDSYVKLPNNFVYTPFTTNYLIAEGGGAGGTLGYYRQLSPPRSFYYSLGPYGGGSAGGAGSALDGTAQGGSAGGNPNGGLNGQVQGYRGGLASGVSPSTGGGGAGATGVDGGKTDGGIGAQYNLTGTPTYYAGGGAGAGRTPGLGTLGRGGSAPGNIGSSGTNGQGGIVIIAWPICAAASYGCIVSKFIGIGSSEPSYPFGASFDFIDCNTNTTATLRPNVSNPFGYCISGSLSAINIQPSSTGAFANCQVCSEVITDCETRSAVCGQTSGTITYTPCGQTSSITLAIAGNTGYDVCMSGSYSTTGDVSVGLTRGKCYATSSLSCQAYTPCYYRTFKAGASVATASYWQCNATASVTTYISASQSLQVSLNITKPSSLTGTGASVLSYYNCTSYRFTAGPSGGTATFLYCGLGNSGSVVLGANEQTTICCVTGTTALTGGGSIITNLGGCVTGSSGLALWP